VGENHVGFLGVQQLVEGVVAGGVDLGVAVDLAREQRPGLEDLARLLRLGRADGRGFLGRLALEAGLAAGQVQADDIVPQLGVARRGAPAADSGSSG
jgi:hypothetical protein